MIMKAGDTKEWKQSFSLTMKYTIYEWWYFSAAIHWYPEGAQQQSLGFGFFDWHPGTFSLQCSNYSGNRFSSGDLADNNGSFKNGALCALRSWVW